MSLARLHVGRHYNACAFGPDGLLYVAGAFRHTGQLADAEVYDPRADRWRVLPKMPLAVQFGAGAWLF